MVEPQDDFTIRQKTTMVKRPTKDNKEYKDNKVLNKDNKDIPQNLQFFNREKYFDDLLAEFSEALKVPREKMEQEFNHFILYWTEPNKSGTKVRWELERTFDVKRRLYTWMKNKQTWSKEKQQNKGKEIIGL